jgi:hypothetical protein
VRIDRASALPDRCVACNEPAQSYRVKRTLYHSPLAWRIGAFVTPFAATLLGLWLNIDLLVVSFWPLVLLLLVANFFVRKSLKLQLGLCQRHRRLRGLLFALSALAICGVVAGIGAFYGGPLGPAILALSILALLGLALAQSFLGASAVRLKELDGEHAWLTGTGAAFRAGLPELQ